MRASGLASFYRRLKAYLHNTAWILFEKFAGLLLGLFVTIVIARHFGPHDFGIFSYVLSVSAIFSVASHMGLNGLVIKELIKKPLENEQVLGTAFSLKFLGMLFGYLLMLAYSGVIDGVSSIEFVGIAIVGAALLLRPLDVIDYWFQALLQAKYSSIAKIIALCISSGIKLGLVVMGLSISWFFAANAVQVIISGFLLVAFFFHSGHQKFSIFDWRYSSRIAKELFSQGWMVFLGTVFSMIYLKIDQVMLKWLKSPDDVGTYAVAVQLSEAWYFVANAIVISFFPKLIKIREENKALFYDRLQQLFDFLFLIALSVAIVLTFFSEWIITILFGDRYIESASILSVHIWAAIFIFMRAAVSKWILIENVLIFSLVTQGLGALCNVFLNYIFIPEYGGMGAAFATLVSYATASFLALSCHKKTRKLFWLMCKSFLLPFRYGKMIFLDKRFDD